MRNKAAAERYRKKKREEYQSQLDQMNTLQVENHTLRLRVTELESEVSYLRSIIKAPQQQQQRPQFGPGGIPLPPGLAMGAGGGGGGGGGGGAGGAGVGGVGGGGGGAPPGNSSGGLRDKKASE